MEKQRSFPWKSTRFLVLSVTLSFSLLFSLWLFRAPALIHQESYFLLNSLNFQSLPNSSEFNLEYATNLSKTQFRKPLISSGFEDNSSIEVNDSESKEVSTSFGEKYSVNDVKVVNLRGTQLRKNQDTYGFVESSMNVGEFTVDEKKKYEVRRDFELNRGKGELNLSSVSKEIQEKEGKDCDVFKGRWVFDDSYPLYTNYSCPFIDEGFDCQGNGRLDKDYMKWRWQPQDCDIPRFNATNMLELIRGKRLVFAGDSINRNQWESLLCLLMGAVKDPTKVYETRGRRIVKTRGAYSFRFVEYQCTVEFYVTHFLVRESKTRLGKKRRETLRIDSIAKESPKWKGADILIFNTGNWWTHTKTKAGINYYQEGREVHPHLDSLTAYRKALTTWAMWVDKQINPNRTQVLFRSTAPAHFREGQWNTGGHCREAQKPLKEMYIDNPDRDLIAREVISTMKTPVTFVNVTGLSSYRIDGHPSKYGKAPGKKGPAVEDCSHWCLPGVPDVWNQLIYYQLLLKQQKNAYTSVV